MKFVLVWLHPMIICKNLPNDVIDVCLVMLKGDFFLGGCEGKFDGWQRELVDWKWMFQWWLTISFSSCIQLFKWSKLIPLVIGGHIFEY